LTRSFVANLPLSPSVKKVLKSVNINLVKLWARVWCLVFLIHGVYLLPLRSNKVTEMFAEFFTQLFVFIQSFFQKICEDVNEFSPYVKYRGSWYAKNFSKCSPENWTSLMTVSFNYCSGRRAVMLCGWKGDRMMALAEINWAKSWSCPEIVQSWSVVTSYVFFPIFKLSWVQSQLCEWTSSDL